MQSLTAREFTLSLVQAKEDLMSQHLKTGDRVSWNTPQRVTHGKIVRVISTHTTMDGRTIDASTSDPHYEVQSEKSGKHAVHRGDALHRVKN
jgi:2-hydroxychromene-2-carboxylate isomerase